MCTASYYAAKWNNLSQFYKLVCEGVQWGVTSHSQTDIFINFTIQFLVLHSQLTCSCLNCTSFTLLVLCIPSRLTDKCKHTHTDLANIWGRVQKHPNLGNTTLNDLDRSCDHFQIWNFVPSCKDDPNQLVCILKNLHYFGLCTHTHTRAPTHPSNDFTVTVLTSSLLFSSSTLSSKNP